MYFNLKDSKSRLCYSLLNNFFLLFNASMFYVKQTVIPYLSKKKIQLET